MTSAPHREQWTIVPNLVDAPELTTLAIILWVALCVFISLLDRTPRSYMFVLAGYTAALIGFPSVLAPGTVFDTAVSRVEEITIGVLCAAVVHSLIFPKSALSAFEQKLRSAIADARLWIAEGLTKAPTPQLEMERRRIAVDITELYTLGTSLRFDTSPRRPVMGSIRSAKLGAHNRASQSSVCCALTKALRSTDHRPCSAPTSSGLTRV
jgi:uncharacterized membrane protein YccC